MWRRGVEEEVGERGGGGAGGGGDAGEFRRRWREWGLRRCGEGARDRERGGGRGKGRRRRAEQESRGEGGVCMGRGGAHTRVHRGGNVCAYFALANECVGIECAPLTRKRVCTSWGGARDAWPRPSRALPREASSRKRVTNAKRVTKPAPEALANAGRGRVRSVDNVEREAEESVEGALSPSAPVLPRHVLLGPSRRRTQDRVPGPHHVICARARGGGIKRT